MSKLEVDKWVKDLHIPSPTPDFNLNPSGEILAEYVKGQSAALVSANQEAEIFEI